MTSAAQRLAVGTVISRSIGKKLIVALTGVALVVFILFHLAGNLLVLGGRDLFNAYASRLGSLGPLLWVARVGLVAVFGTHIVATILVTLENRRARGGERYAVYAPKGGDHWATRTMIYTGLLVLAFLFLHLYDFSLSDREGPLSIVAGASTAESQGLYGLVWNRFLNIPRAIFYILAVTAVGMHLSHGIQSMFQTVGVYHEQYSGVIDKISLGIGVFVALGFSTVPIYVIIRHFTVGVGL
jgi:succinate dehydrogenase / fumarate reductase cytochrome b subunit